MKKFLLLIFTLCFIATLFFICGTAGGESGTKSADIVKNENVINIGVFEPLTGDDSQSGMQETLGIRYANSVCPTVDINGVKYDIKLQEQDNMSDVSSASDSAQTLLNSKVTAVLGSSGSWLTAEGNKVFSKANIPVLGISCSSPLLTEDCKNLFRVCYSDSFQSGVLANYAYQINCRNAAVLTQTGDIYSKNFGKLISGEFSKIGGKTNIYDIQNNQKNFRSLITSIQENGNDCVFVSSSSYEAKYFIEQARELGLNCPIIGSENWDSALLLNECTPAFSNVYLASGFNSSDSGSSEFSVDFSSWLNSDKTLIEENGGSDYVSSDSALAYDSYMLVVNAMKEAKSTDSKAVLEALKTITYKGITGNIKFSNNGDSGKSLAYIKTLNVGNKCFDVLQTNSVGK